MSETTASLRREQRYRRTSVRLSARISTIDPETDPESGKPYFRSSDEVCQNVSRGGAFVMTSEPVSPGRRLLIELDIPGGASVQTVGRVAWSRVALSGEGGEVRSGIGIEFLAAQPEQLTALERYVERLSRPSRPAPELGRSVSRSGTL